MRPKRFAIPTILLFTQFAAAACSPAPQPDASMQDVPVADLGIADSAADIGADIANADSGLADTGSSDAMVTCTAVALSDGGVQCVGGSPELFCIGPLSGCTVADGGASEACCQLVG